MGDDKDETKKRGGDSNGFGSPARLAGGDEAHPGRSTEPVDIGGDEFHPGGPTQEAGGEDDFGITSDGDRFGQGLRKTSNTEWKVEARDGQALGVGLKLHFSRTVQSAGDSFPIRLDDRVTVSFTNNTEISLRVTAAPDDLRLLRLIDDKEPSWWLLELATMDDGEEYYAEKENLSSWQWWVVRKRLPSP